MAIEERNPKIYIISNDQYVQDYMVLMLVGENYEVKLYLKQNEALAEIEKATPDLIISEFNSLDINGLEVCKAIRRIPQFSHIPLLFMLENTGPEQLNKAKLVYAGADDYIQKSLLEEELLLRVKLNLYRASRQQDVHPLSRLPGQVSLIKELQKRIGAKKQMAVCCADLCQFKQYNQRYGFKKGDEVIKYTSTLMLKILRDSGSSVDFLSHPDGGRFFFITEPSTAEEIAGRIIKEFDAGILSFYDAEDRNNGGISLKNRKGEVQKFPLLQMHVGIATNEHFPFIDPTQVVQIATELKDFAQKSFEKSMYVKERRREWPFS